ncbi:hypothetical protein ACFL3M_02155 [Patescibacteria group bacterium]
MFSVSQKSKRFFSVIGLGLLLGVAVVTISIIQIDSADFYVKTMIKSGVYQK